MCTGLLWEPEGNITLGTAVRRWDDDFKLHLKETVCQGVNHITLTQDRTRNALLKRRQ
jgi:hypothetical protein